MAVVNSDLEVSLISIIPILLRSEIRLHFDNIVLF